jgi:hypothetical protein
MRCFKKKGEDMCECSINNGLNQLTQKQTANNPINITDPTGHWNRYVHYDLTRTWAIDIGFPAYHAGMIAGADVRVDTQYKWSGLKNAKWHTSYQFAFDLLYAAYYKTGSLIGLGQGLHVIQDWATHRFGLKKQKQTGILYMDSKKHYDLWNSTKTPKGAKTYTEDYTKSFLRAFYAKYYRKGKKVK